VIPRSRMFFFDRATTRGPRVFVFNLRREDEPLPQDPAGYRHKLRQSTIAISGRYWRGKAYIEHSSPVCRAQAHQGPFTPSRVRAPIFGSEDLPDSRHRPAHRFGRQHAGMLPLEPCLPTAASSPPAGSHWLHEVKHDGYRMLARRDGERVLLGRRSSWDELSEGEEWVFRWKLWQLANAT